MNRTTQPPRNPVPEISQPTSYAKGVSQRSPRSAKSDLSDEAPPWVVWSRGNINAESVAQSAEVWNSFSVRMVVGHLTQGAPLRGDPGLRCGTAALGEFCQELLVDFVGSLPVCFASCYSNVAGPSGPLAQRRIKRSELLVLRALSNEC
jgi:hypothetical protein